MVLKTGEANPITKDTKVFEKGATVKSVALVLKGRLAVFNQGFCSLVGPGTFVGVMDVFNKTHLFSVRAIEDAVILLFSANSPEDIRSILSLNKDYAGLIIRSLNNIAKVMIQNVDVIQERANTFYHFMKNAEEAYLQVITLAGKYSEMNTSISEYSYITKGVAVSQVFLEEINEETEIPINILVEMYAKSPIKAYREITQKCDEINTICEKSTIISEGIVNLTTILYNKSEQSFFNLIGREMYKLPRVSKNYLELLIVFEQAKRELILNKEFFKHTLKQDYRLDIEALNLQYDKLLAGQLNELEDIDSESKSKIILGNLSNSLRKILDFGKIEKSVAEQFTHLVEQFYQLRNKQAVDESVRTLRRQLIEAHYQVYKSVFIQTLKVSNYPRIIDLFLQYGYVDERLLTKEQLILLYELESSSIPTSFCHCYRLNDWLKLIVKGEKEPTKNGFDLEYRDYIRKQRMDGEISEQEERELIHDGMKKLNFEIENILKTIMRMTSGRISYYVPILYQDEFPLNIESSYVEGDKVDQTIQNILQVDFSLFYREVVYTNPNLINNKELVQQEYFPDIIILPCAGAQGVMWQEITGKSRASSGRFFLPIFNEENLYDTILKVVGRYRWELCRTLQGMAWYDIKNKCLTSEYMDYIQCFRKNKNLSEDRKEKVKSQLKKAHNNIREFFVMDYELWIKYESKATLRLNKVARELMATYCPFTAQIRNNMSNGEAMQRFERNLYNQIRVLDAKILAMEKRKLEIPKEILVTRDFYKR